MPASDILIKGAREHNLRNVDVALPRNQLICLTGVSGSGKSSLVVDTLARALARKLHGVEAQPGKHRGLRGTSQIDRLQSALDRRHGYRDI